MKENRKSVAEDKENRPPTPSVTNLFRKSRFFFDLLSPLVKHQNKPKRIVEKTPNIVFRKLFPDLSDTRGQRYSTSTFPTPPGAPLPTRRINHMRLNLEDDPIETEYSKMWKDSMLSDKVSLNNVSIIDGNPGHSRCLDKREDLFNSTFIYPLHSTFKIDDLIINNNIESLLSNQTDDDVTNLHNSFTDSPVTQIKYFHPLTPIASRTEEKPNDELLTTVMVTPQRNCQNAIIQSKINSNMFSLSNKKDGEKISEMSTNKVLIRPGTVAIRAKLNNKLVSQSIFPQSTINKSEKTDRRIITIGTTKQNIPTMKRENEYILSPSRQAPYMQSKENIHETTVLHTTPTTAEKESLTIVTEVYSSEKESVTTVLDARNHFRKTRLISRSTQTDSSSDVMSSIVKNVDINKIFQGNPTSNDQSLRTSMAMVSKILKKRKKAVHFTQFNTVQKTHMAKNKSLNRRKFSKEKLAAVKSLVKNKSGLIENSQFKILAIF